MRFYAKASSKGVATELMQVYGLKPDLRDDETGTYFEFSFPEFWSMFRKQTFIKAIERYDSRVLARDSVRLQAGISGGRR
jgi:hypothetical protein